MAKNMGVSWCYQPDHLCAWLANARGGFRKAFLFILGLIFLNPSSQLHVAPTFCHLKSKKKSSTCQQSKTNTLVLAWGFAIFYRILCFHCAWAIPNYTKNSMPEFTISGLFDDYRLRNCTMQRYRSPRLWTCRLGFFPAEIEDVSQELVHNKDALLGNDLLKEISYVYSLVLNSM